MKLRKLKTQLRQQFKLGGIDVCDADFIIAEVLNVGRTNLVFVDEISKKQHNQIMRAVKLRLNGMPVDKIFGKAYFCGRTFRVSKSVLSPRQDSEILVEKAVEIIRQNNFKTLLDLCTGSGCLAISIFSSTLVDTTATDISRRAIKIAKQNALLNDAKIKFVYSDLFKNLSGKFDVIVSNPPYIRTGDLSNLDREVKNFDPKLALDGGADGLDFYRKIAGEVKNYLNKGGYLLLEIGYNQQEAVKKIFKDLQFVQGLKDLGENDRVLVFRN